jgi:hypothetical protein
MHPKLQLQRFVEANRNDLGLPPLNAVDKARIRRKAEDQKGRAFHDRILLGSMEAYQDPKGSPPITFQERLRRATHQGQFAAEIVWRSSGLDPKDFM